jgi:hypothetical protein
VIRAGGPSFRLNVAVALASLASSALPAAVQAQYADAPDARVAPQWVQYRVQTPGGATVSELALPVFVVVPAGSRLSFDVGTAYARARVTSGASRSEVAGLTDTEIRGSYTFGSDFVVLTAGVSLPTGQSSVTLEQLAAAGWIGSDFLDFPVSSMGTGLAATGGVAIARPAGAWSIGGGAAVRRSAAYEPFDIPDETFRYRPGNEFRARLGADRPVGAGRLALGLTYATFGREDASGFAYNTGDRVVAQGSLTGAVGEHDFTIAAYDLLRAPGSYASGERAGRENLANLFLSLGVHALGTVWEPSVELRQWERQQHDAATSGAAPTRSSRLATLGLRVRAEVAGIALYPSAAVTLLGSLATEDDAGAPVQAGLSGFRVGVMARAAR